MLSVTFFFNQTDKIRFWSVWAINSFLGIWMTVEQNKLSGFFIRPTWPLQITKSKFRNHRKMHVFSKNVSQNLVLVQRLLCARSVLSFGPHSHHNTIRDCPEAFPWVYDHHQGAGSSKSAWENTYHFGRSHIWICAFTNLAKCQVIWELDSLLPIPGGGHTLPKMPQNNP